MNRRTTIGAMLACIAAPAVFVVVSAACGGPPKFEMVDVGGHKIEFVAGSKVKAGQRVAEHNDVMYVVANGSFVDMKAAAAQGSGAARTIGDALIAQLMPNRSAFVRSTMRFRFG